MMSLEGRVAVITGAGTGIGQAIALAMAKAGTSIAVDYVGKARIAQDSIDQIAKIGGKVIGVDADISSPEDVAMLIQRTVESFGKLDIFREQCGIEKKFTFVDYPLEEWQKIMAVNLTGPFLCSQAQRSR